MNDFLPLWNVGLIFTVAIVLLCTTWSGWRSGIMRSAASLLALVVSGLVAYGIMYVGASVSPLTSIFAALGVGIALYFIIWLLGIIFFKKTSQQTFPGVHFLWGFGGAVLGLFWGLVVLWSLIPVVRSAGIVAQAQCEVAHKQSLTPPLPTQALVATKEALEIGPLGKVVQALDTTPPNFYTGIENAMRLAHDPQLAEKLLANPAIQDIVNHPSFVALLNDPALANMAQSGNFLALMRSPALLAAATDQDLAAKIKKVNWTKLLSETSEKK